MSSNSLGDLYVNLKTKTNILPIKDLQKNLQQVESQSKKTGLSLSKVFKSVKGIKKFRKQMLMTAGFVTISTKVASNMFRNANESLESFAETAKAGNMSIKQLSDNLKKVTGFDFITKDQIESFKKIKTQTKILKISFNSLRNQILGDVAPVFTEFLQSFKKLLINNQKEIKTFASFFLKLGIRIVTVFTRMISLGGGLIRVLQKSKILTIGLSIGFLGIMAKLKPFTLLLSGIFLIIEDIFTYMKGGKSITGLLINSFKELPNLSEILGINAAMKGINNLIARIKELGNIFKGKLGNTINKLLFGSKTNPFKRKNDKNGNIDMPSMLSQQESLIRKGNASNNKQSIKQVNNYNIRANTVDKRYMDNLQSEAKNNLGTLNFLPS